MKQQQCASKQSSIEPNNSIMTNHKPIYTTVQKVFCCRCMPCLRNEIVFTSDLRKQTLQRMIRNYAIDENSHEDTLYDPIKLMILIYLCEDQTIPKGHINRCRLNPAIGSETYRTDLQFYIPQLCNFIVFHSNLQSYLSETMERGCKLSYFFGHYYYFYMKSLQKSSNNYQLVSFPQIQAYNSRFLAQINKNYEGQMLNAVQVFLGEKINSLYNDPQIGYLVKNYGTSKAMPNKEKVEAKQIALPPYSSLMGDSKGNQLYSFKSTINFFQDLFAISEELKNHENKEEKLKQLLMEVNARLPACIYIPFSQNSFQYYNVLNIHTPETKVFSTKQRAPYYICLEIYCPIESFGADKQSKFWEAVERPITLKPFFRSQSILHRNLTLNNLGARRFSNARFQINYKKVQNPYSNSIQTQILSQRNSHQMHNKLLEFTEMKTQPRIEGKDRELQSVKTNKATQEVLDNIFGESEVSKTERIRKSSIFGELQSWDLIHLIVKTGDNLKQQQFALQLIYQFDSIFKMEKLPLLLTPYEVISMSHDSGIIQMVQGSITFDRLKRTLRTKLDKEYTLKQFFELYFGEQIVTAKDQFMRSLAAYSLVMYFLQAKDRHNGKILHIDFGFFLSNMPGRGIELEKDVPFKLMTQYIDIMDGINSYYFKKFRQYLFQGFKAIRKHQNKITMLVKMMYSSSGVTMPCFQKGEEAIISMERRFNPPNVVTDAQLNLHCQSLIDRSLDNRRARWYDYWQYYFQGIFY